MWKKIESKRTIQAFEKTRRREPLSSKIWRVSNLFPFVSKKELFHLSIYQRIDVVSVPSFIFMMVTQIGSFELMYLTKTLGSNFVWS